MNFSEKLYHLRTTNGLSQTKLANAINVSQSSVNYWEKGQRKPSYESACDLAKYFHVSVDSLLSDSYNNVVDDKPKVIDTKICENILKLRKKKNMSQEELSKLSGIPLTLIEEYENKICIPKNNNVIRLASVLDPEGSELLGIELPFAIYEEGDVIGNSGYKESMPITDNQIHFSEYHLLESFRQLNELGKKEAEKRIDELTEIKKYIE